MTFREKLVQFRRLQILRFLSEAPGYETSQDVLYQALEDVSAADVRDDLLFMEARSLVQARDLAGIRMAKVTQRGVDVARGVELADGVARPGPGGT